MRRTGFLLISCLFVLLSCDGGINHNPMECTLYQILCDQGEVEYCEFAEECRREQDE